VRGKNSKKIIIRGVKSIEKVTPHNKNTRGKKEGVNFPLKGKKTMRAHDELR